jgi:amidase
VTVQTFSPEAIKYVYSPEHEPIGSVDPGERFAVVCEDCFTGRFRDAAEFNPASAAWVDEHLNGLTGPIHVRGAQAGGAVEVTIESVEILSPGCVVVSRCEARSPADWWHEEDHAVNLPIAGGLLVLGDGWTVPVAPLIGCLGVAPARETILSRHEGSFGGNLDCREIAAGATVTLPVGIPGASLYFGDCKAALGDGEVVAAPEVAARIVASTKPVGRPASMTAPRVRTDDTLTTIVSGISLADAARAAFAALKHWLEDEWQLSSDEAAIVMGIGAHCGVGQVSNRLHTAKCSIALALLPDTERRM